MDWLKKLKKYAPDIAMAVATGGATLPMLAAKAVSDAVGVEINDTDQLSQVISGASPEVMLKVTHANNSFKIRMRELDVELTHSELRNMEHAREMHRHSRMPSFIVCALTLMVAGATALLFLYALPEENKEISYLLFGALLAKWGDSIAYWVGTTRSSAEKTRRMKAA